MTKYAERQKGNIHLSDQAITWIIGVVISAASGAGGVLAAYSGIKEEIAVIKTEIRYTRGDIQELKEEVKDLRNAPRP